MSRKLVLYFSVYGTTKIIAETVAMQINADISAIESAVPYDTDSSCKKWGKGSPFRKA